MKNESIFLSVIIPCYNEEANLKRDVLSEVYNYLKIQKFAWEVIISDDGSTDSSKIILKKKIKDFTNFKLLENEHGGKPSALLYGIKKSSGKWILFTDMDQSTPISELRKLLPFVYKYKVVIGSRGLKRKNFPIYRKLGAMVFANFRKLLILSEVNDTQCGFKLFYRKLLVDKFPELEFFKRNNRPLGWQVTSFDVELLHILKKSGAKTKEIEVLWNDQDISESKGGGLSRYIRESREMFTQILRVKMNDLKGMYKDS